MVSIMVNACTFYLRFASCYDGKLTKCRVSRYYIITLTFSETSNWKNEEVKRMPIYLTWASISIKDKKDKFSIH